MDFLKIGKATDLSGRDRTLYRVFEVLPGALSWATLLGLLFLSWANPVFIAYFIIAFDVFWLIQVVYLSLHLISAFKKLKKNAKIDWREKCESLKTDTKNAEKDSLALEGKTWDDLIQVIVLPTYNESYEIVRASLQALLDTKYPPEKMIVVLATEERAGQEALEKGQRAKKDFGDKFWKFLVTVHPDGLTGELKGKGANQAWAAKKLKEEIIDKENLDYWRILVSVFDIDTVASQGYFFVLSYRFLTVKNPYRASYQPVPVYHNNIWQAPFFSRVAATSNTFWQMMMQIRSEKLVTYSSHSMPWQALVDIGFWSTNMVSEDSRIFFHCYMYYNGDYRVEPMHYTVSMDATADQNLLSTAKSLYKQQRRWGWGVESVPYLIFNTVKRWDSLPKKSALNQIWVQIYGFHSWATNALVIGFIGWMPVLLGGDSFNSTVLSGNLPGVSTTLMNMALVGLFLSAIISTLLLPNKPKGYSSWKRLFMLLEWVIIPVSIIIFGSVPGLEAQTRLMFGKYMGFWVTPKKREMGG